MKNILIFFGLLLTMSSCSLFQNKEIKTLSTKVDSLTRIVDTLTKQNKILDDEFTWVENELIKLNAVKKTAAAPSVSAPASNTVSAVAPKPVKDWQCIAITSSGKRCSRPAVEGSSYCWQHKKTYEPNAPDVNKNAKTGAVEEKK